MCSNEGNYVIGEICQQFTQRVWKLCLHNPWCPLGACTCRRKDICGLLKVTKTQCSLLGCWGESISVVMGWWPCSLWHGPSDIRGFISKLPPVSSIDIGKFWLLAILTTYTSFVTDFLSGYHASKHRHQIILNLVHVQPIVISAQYELTASIII